MDKVEIKLRLEKIKGDHYRMYINLQGETPTGFVMEAIAKLNKDLETKFTEYFIKKRIKPQDVSKKMIKEALELPVKDTIEGIMSTDHFNQN